MKKYLTLICIAICSSVHLTAQNFEFDSIGHKSMDVGNMEYKDGLWLIRVDKGHNSEYFVPVNLPDRFKIKGQDVVFEGAIGRRPMNSNPVGTPLRLSMIRILYKAKPNGENGEQIITDDNAKEKNDSIGYLRDVKGKIVLIGDAYIIEVTTGSELKRYVPDYLPEDFKKANTEITFSAVVRSIPPNVRMMGSPITIKELMMIQQLELDNAEIQQSLKKYYPFDSVAYLPPTKGKIKFNASNSEYIIEVDNGRNSITTYLPVILPKEFKIDGIEVIVSGDISKIPNGSKLSGFPLSLDEIRIAE